MHVVAAPPPDARRAHIAVGLSLDKTRRVEHFSVISRSDAAQVRRGALLRQTSWVLRFRAGKHPLLCAENGDASVDGRDAFRFATAGKDAATVCAGDRIDLFADLGADVLRVRHGSRVYEVSLRRFGFDTGRLRPVVEVSVEIKFTARSSSIAASTSTPSTRHLFDGVAMSVPHRLTEPARPRHRREMT